MSATNYSGPSSWRGMCSNGGSGRCGGSWSGTNIAAMILGFVFWWPLGLAVMLWAFTGHKIDDLPAWAREKWAQLFPGDKVRTDNGSDNVVFNEYQQTQYDRIQEIKEEIKKRAEAFRTFRSDARRRKDQREFEEFMASSPDKR